jgi:hypothetical protein
VPLDDDVEAGCRSWRSHNLPGPGLEHPVREAQQLSYPPGRPPASNSQDGHRALAAARSETEMSAWGQMPSEGSDSERQASVFERPRCASLVPEGDPDRNAAEAVQGMYEYEKRPRRKTRLDRYDPKTRRSRRALKKSGARKERLRAAKKIMDSFKSDSVPSGNVIVSIH